MQIRGRFKTAQVCYYFAPLCLHLFQFFFIRVAQCLIEARVFKHSSKL
jgi:hypothetical protein